MGALKLEYHDSPSPLKIAHNEAFTEGVKEVWSSITIDPLAHEYPELSPYQWASNNPIAGIDLDGRETLPPSNYSPTAVDQNGTMVVKTSESIIDGVIYTSTSIGAHFINGITFGYGDLKNGNGYETQTFLKAVGFSWTAGLRSEKYSNGNIISLGDGFRLMGGVSDIIGLGEFGAGFYEAKYGMNEGLFATEEGFLFGHLNVTAPLDIPVQRFGGMSLKESPFALRTGTSKFLARNFNAIKPRWNKLDVYTTGVIPRGTKIKIGLAAPQSNFRIGLLPQINVQARQVVKQTTKIVKKP